MILLYGIILLSILIISFLLSNIIYGYTYRRRILKIIILIIVFLIGLTSLFFYVMARDILIVRLLEVISNYIYESSYIV